MVALVGQAAALEPGRADTPRAACILAPRRPAGRYRHLDVGSRSAVAAQLEAYSTAPPNPGARR
jgi:hypothetical protein